MANLNGIYCSLVISTLLCGCPQDKAKNGQKRVDVPTATGSTSDEGIIFIQVEVNSQKRQLFVTLSNVPAKAQLECAVEKEKLSECSEKFTLGYPKEDGIYTFTAVAKINKQVVAVGEKKFPVGEASELDEPLKNFQDTQKYADDLSLELDPDFKINDQKFTNRMPVDVTQATEFKFRFRKQPSCPVEVRCTSDALSSKFKPLCDTMNTKVFKPGTMPKGLQFLRIEASCGDKVGEPLLLYWYGVPKGYAFMSITPTIIEDTSKAQKRYYFNLVNDADCAESDLTFECQTKGGGSFKKCDNFVDNPPAKFTIRAVCSGKTPDYEPFVLN